MISLSLGVVHVDTTNDVKIETIQEPDHELELKLSGMNGMLQRQGSMLLFSQVDEDYYGNIAPIKKPFRPNRLIKDRSIRDLLKAAQVPSLRSSMHSEGSEHRFSDD